MINSLWLYVISSHLIDHQLRNFNTEQNDKGHGIALITPSCSFLVHMDSYLWTKSSNFKISPCPFLNLNWHCKKQWKNLDNGSRHKVLTKGNEAWLDHTNITLHHVGQSHERRHTHTLVDIHGLVSTDIHRRNGLTDTPDSQWLIKMIIPTDQSLPPLEPTSRGGRWAVSTSAPGSCPLCTSHLTSDGKKNNTDARQLPASTII